MFHEGGIQTRLVPAEGLLCTCNGSTIQLVSLFRGGARGWEWDRGVGEGEGPGVMNGARQAAGKASGQIPHLPRTPVLTRATHLRSAPAGPPLPPSSPHARIILALFPRRLCLPTGD